MSSIISRMNAQEKESDEFPYEGPRDVRDRIDRGTSALLAAICDLEVRTGEVLTPEQRAGRLEILRHLTYARGLLIEAYEQTNPKFNASLPWKLHI